MARASLPQNYRITDHTDMVLLDDSTDWTIFSNGTGYAVADDAVNTKTNSTAVSVTTPNAGADSILLTQESVGPITVDADTWVGLQVYLPEVNEGLSGSPALQLYLSDADTGFTNYWRMKRLLESGELQSGWNMLTGRLGDTAHFALDGTSPSYANGVRNIRFSLDHNDPTNTTPITYVYDRLVVLGRERPKIMITLDDGDDEQFSIAKGILDTNNMAATCYVNTDSIGNSGILTWANLTTLQDAGWDIANHLSAHTNWTTITVEAGAALYETCRGVLLSKGFTRAADHFASPNGGRDLAIEAKLRTLGALTHRTTESKHYYDIPNETMPILGCKILGSGTSLADAKKYVDDAIDSGATGTFLGHVFAGSASDNRTWATTDFTSLVEYIALKRNQGLLDVVTISQWDKRRKGRA